MAACANDAFAGCGDGELAFFNMLPTNIIVRGQMQVVCSQFCVPADREIDALEAHFVEHCCSDVDFTQPRKVGTWTNKERRLLEAKGFEESADMFTIYSQSKRRRR